MTPRASAQLFIQTYSFQKEKYPNEKWIQTTLALATEWLNLIDKSDLSFREARAFIESLERANAEIGKEAGSAWLDLSLQIEAWARGIINKS